MEKNVVKIETLLPVFSGFYGSLLGSYIEELINSEIEYQEEVNSKSLDAYDYDYKKLCFDVVKILPEVLEFVLLEKADFEIDISFIELNSPRFYNFENDSISCEITIDLNYVISLLEIHSKLFENYLKDNYSSYDGFVSFVDTNILNWISGNNELLEKYLYIALDFIFVEVFDITEIDLYNKLTDSYNIYPQLN